MARKSRLKPYEAAPGEDIFDNVVNPGDSVAMATKSYGSVHINKGRYLGRRASTYHKDAYFYIVEQDRVRRVRMNAAGEIWMYRPWYPNRHTEQGATLHAVIGEEPKSPHQPYRWGTPEYAQWKRDVYDPYMIQRTEHHNKKEAWLDEHYPWTAIPYVRRSTLQCNQIIKL